MAPQLTDAFARKFYYLRLSITDVCNFRCTYCLPDGYKPGRVSNNGFLSVDEVRRVTRAFSAMGTEKVRLTGGEPSLRRDFTDIISTVRENDAIRQIAVTTNGYRLARDAQQWRDAGLTHVNVSVDSLDARQFHAITGQDKFQQVMDGIDAAFDAGFAKVKVNTVLMRAATGFVSPPRENYTCACLAMAGSISVICWRKTPSSRNLKRAFLRLWPTKSKPISCIRARPVLLRIFHISAAEPLLNNVISE
jgi:sulfatase maturation enzyme AslB (radical SAM superfamily)